MSPENVELVRRVWEQFRDEDDLGAWVESEAVAEDFDWVLSTPLDGRAVWHGREEYVEFMRTWTEQFDDWSIRAEQFIDAGGDRVVVISHQTATGRGSRVPVELKLWQVVDVEDGRMIRSTIYFTEAEALEATRLREWPPPQ